MNQAPNKVVGELEEVRAIITRPENILIHMAANLDTLTPQGYRNTVIVHFSGNIGLEMELRNMLLYIYQWNGKGTSNGAKLRLAEEA